MAIKVVSEAKQEALTQRLIDFLIGDVDATPKVIYTWHCSYSKVVHVTNLHMALLIQHGRLYTWHCSYSTVVHVTINVTKHVAGLYSVLNVLQRIGM